MSDKKCENCKKDVWIFEVEIYDEEIQIEYYCNDCLANIFENDPTVIKSVKRIEETF